MFAAFAYAGARAMQGDECDAQCDRDNSDGRACLPTLQPATRTPAPLPAAQRQAIEPLPPQQAFGDDAGWAEAIYGRFTASGLLPGTLDAQHPTVPVILHPSAPRGGAPPLVTARHLGFLRVDLTGEGVGPGRFFPLFPEGGPGGWMSQKDVVASGSSGSL